MKRIILFCFALLTWVYTIRAQAVEVSLSSEEKRLYGLIMQYRAENGLPFIPLSPCLTYVAQTHVRDLQEHSRDEGCNLHSWSNYGNWSPVCYTSNPTEDAMKAVWNKPRELTAYPGAGYEISHWYSAGATATSAINGWKKSPPHNATMINLNNWSDNTWQAIGIGIYGDYAVVWFGEEEDPETIKASKPNSQPAPVVVSATQNTPQKTQDDKTEQRLKELEQQLLMLQTEKEQTARKPATDERDSKIAQQNSEIKALKAEQEKLQKELKRLKEKNEQKETYVAPKKQDAPKQVKDRSGNLLSRFFNYSGFSSLNYFSAGYMFSFMSNSHMVNASILDFRASLFGASLLNVEMSVSPFHKRFAYKPHIRIYIPVAKCFSIAPFGGAEIDASYIGKFFDKNYTYDVTNDFYINAIGGLALNLTAARNVPMEINIEYRHPVLVPAGGALNPQGIYVGAKIYVGSVFDKK